MPDIDEQQTRSLRTGDEFCIPLSILKAFEMLRPRYITPRPKSRTRAHCQPRL